MWFDIKTKPTTEKALLHFLQMIRRSRYLPEDIRSVHDAVENYKYFVYPEASSRY